MNTLKGGHPKPILREIRYLNCTAQCHAAMKLMPNWPLFSDAGANAIRALDLRYRGTAFIKERINLNALKLLENFSRLACHCDALVFLFYRSPVTPLPERRRNTLLSVLRIRVRLAN